MKGRQRTGKFYYQNEARVMKSLGLSQTKGSGNGEVEKEDGQNEFVIAQLKSTDKNSFTIKRIDIDKLEYNAGVARKIPIFIVEFLQDGKLYFLASMHDIPELAKYLETGKVEINPIICGNDDWDDNEAKPVISSSSKSRQAYQKERDKRYAERGKK